MSYFLRHATTVAHACAHKCRHGTEAAARKAAQRAIRENQNAERLWVYACAKCRGWHLTRDHSGSPAVTANALREGIA